MPEDIQPPTPQPRRDPEALAKTLRQAGIDPGEWAAVEEAAAERTQAKELEKIGEMMRAQLNDKSYVPEPSPLIRIRT
ncbi:hypothetical protein EWI61_08965 [Methylolobus aquaticus]|nr:hypothetical protein EWI61_08965 [Methylolobus aquaticus]